MVTTTLKCPMCGSDARTKVITLTFPYGYPEAVTLTVPMFPVGHCEDCEFEWYGSEGADLIDATVLKYKRILALTQGGPEANTMKQPLT